MRKRFTMSRTEGFFAAASVLPSAWPRFSSANGSSTSARNNPGAPAQMNACREQQESVRRIRRKGIAGRGYKRKTSESARGVRRLLPRGSRAYTAPDLTKTTAQISFPDFEIEGELLSFQQRAPVEKQKSGK